MTQFTGSAAKMLPRQLRTPSAAATCGGPPSKPFSIDERKQDELLLDPPADIAGADQDHRCLKDLRTTSLRE